MNHFDGQYSANDKSRLNMIYHPEGVIRPDLSPTEDSSPEFVYDYFIKDYLENVRAVISEEDAIKTQEFLATLEEVWAAVEEQNYDNLGETRYERPPVDVL